MPKFSDSERAIIQEQLLTEGEQLFIRHGLKKVTVDDLVNGIGIAKGSFYAFYKSKEHLYMEILFSMSRKVITATKEFLRANDALKQRELVKKMVAWSYGEIEKYPLLQQYDMEVDVHLNRKLAKEMLDRYSDIDMETTRMLADHGVEFSCDIETAGGVFQALGVVYSDIMTKNKPGNRAIMDILISGAINEVVKE